MQSTALSTPNVCIVSHHHAPLIPVALLNIIEAILNIEYLYLRHTSPHTIRLTPNGESRPRYHAHAPLVGFAAALMTLSKTALYFLQGEFEGRESSAKGTADDALEYYCGWCMVGHNDWWTLAMVWVLPNVSLTRIINTRADSACHSHIRGKFWVADLD